MASYRSRTPSRWLVAPGWASSVSRPRRGSAPVLSASGAGPARGRRTATRRGSARSPPSGVRFDVVILFALQGDPITSEPLDVARTACRWSAIAPSRGVPGSRAGRRLPLSCRRTGALAFSAASHDFEPSPSRSGYWVSPRPTRPWGSAGRASRRPSSSGTSTAPCGPACISPPPKDPDAPVSKRERHHVRLPARRFDNPQGRPWAR